MFIFAPAFAVAYLSWLGHTWLDIQASVVARLATALPAFFILFAIGLLIASWMISGTIRMLVYYGIAIISPGLLYPLACLAPVVFYTLPEAAVLVEQWRRLYNTVRPHSAWGGIPPAPETIRPSSWFLRMPQLLGPPMPQCLT